MSMIAAALPLVGGVLDGKTRGVFAKQFRESSKHDKSNSDILDFSYQTQERMVA